MLVVIRAHTLVLFISVKVVLHHLLRSSNVIEIWSYKTLHLISRKINYYRNLLLKVGKNLNFLIHRRF